MTAASGAQQQHSGHLTTVANRSLESTATLLSLL